MNEAQTEITKTLTEESPKIKNNYMTDNQTNQMPPTDLNKCCECKKPFSKGQGYWELKNKTDGKVAMNSCLPCWDKWATEKKVWEK